MTHGICTQSLVPVRAEASHKSEMVSQLLFGELFEIIEHQQEWVRICNEFDGYKGWILLAQCHATDIYEFEKIKRDSYNVCYDLIGVIQLEEPFPIVIGSNLPFLNKETFNIGNKMYSYKGAFRNIAHCLLNSNKIIEDALMYLNAPYLWGGRSPFGIDCSGFTQMVFKLSGLRLKRDAHEQAEKGSQIHLLEESHPADLAFFENSDGKITHTGILMSPHKIIHASGKVRIDKLDHFGIYNAETKKYTHKLRLIKRMI